MFYQLAKIKQIHTLLARWVCILIIQYSGRPLLWLLISIFIIPQFSILSNIFYFNLDIIMSRISYTYLSCRIISIKRYVMPPAIIFAITDIMPFLMTSPISRHTTNITLDAIKYFFAVLNA